MKRLSKPEQYALVRRAQSGDTAAMHELIVSIWPFIVGKAIRFARRLPIVEPLELANEAAVRVIEKLHKFDCSRDVTFLTYANGWIMEAFHRTRNARYSIVSGAGNALQRYGAAKVLNNQDRLEEVLPNHHRADTVRAALAAVATPIDYQMPNGEQRTHGIVSADQEHGIDHQMTAKTIQDALRFLSDREREIVQRRYLSGSESLGDIGEDMGLSRERVRQIEAKALERLGRVLRRKGVAA